MTMNHAAAGRLASEINMTPMIDVLLVLLIIFMVIVPSTSKGEATLVARSASPIKAVESEPVVLEVLKNNDGDVSFRINQRPVSWADLPGRLGAIYAGRAQRVLFVKGDDHLRFSQIAEVIDASHEAGIDRVCLMTPKAVGL